MRTKKATAAEIELMRDLLIEAEFERLVEMTPEQLMEEFKDEPGLPEGRAQELLRRAIAQVDSEAAAEKARRGDRGA
jgi:hypothetical protein